MNVEVHQLPKNHHLQIFLIYFGLNKSSFNNEIVNINTTILIEVFITGLNHGFCLWKNMDIKDLCLKKVVPQIIQCVKTSLGWLKMNSSILKIGKTQHVMNSFMNLINSLLVLKPNVLKEVNLFISAIINNKLPKIIVQKNVRIPNIIITWG